MLSFKRSRLCGQLLSAFFVMFLASFAVWADTDPNPNSPPPVLISEPNALRVLATNSVRFVGRLNSARGENEQTFAPDSQIVIYVTNLDLMSDESANAFRVSVEDEKGRQYRFPVTDIAPVKGRNWVYALTVSLRDELGFWEEKPTEGDVLIGVTWRGLASNRLKLGFGKIGGTIKDDAGAVLTPFPNTPPIKKQDAPEPDYVGYKYSGDRTRFMEQATFGPTTALDEQIRRQGLHVWLEQQFNAPYPTFPYPNNPLAQTNPPTTCDNKNNDDVPATCYRDTYTMYPVQNWFFQEAFYGNAQLRHRVAWALSQLWVTSGVDVQQARYMVEYHKILSNNAFGNYRTLMGQMTLDPTMGDYLNMRTSTKNNPNENYAREVLQLFNVGLFMLNQDGTQQLDGSGNPIPTYDQTTVNNFTKVFTGWGLCNNQTSCPNYPPPGIVNYIDPMLLNQNNHDVTAKTLLAYPGAVNQNIPAGLSGTTELNMALDNVYNHPNVAPFVSRFLIQQLVESDPTPAYVGRVASVFNANRTSPTQLKEVVKAILLDPEARGDIKTDPNYGKLREPVQLATNFLRQFSVQSADGTTQSDGYVNPQTANMSQNVFNSPTVFNYYPPDYVVPGTGLNGPEFTLLTTGTAIARANFINTMTYGKINGGSTNAPLGTSINLSEMQSLAAQDATSNLLLDTLNTRMMHGTMTAQNKATIMTAVNAIAATDTLNRAKSAIYLTATSSQYQVQR
ncbi:MAG: DUF1800 domain-containing protein [Pyrinomonadaceae bacterium]